MGGPVLFGVRHLSPGAAFHLRRALDEARPQLVLVEGPSDLNDQMHWLCHPDTQFPAAIMAYTSQAPVRTILYPFAVYSPEIQAILWAHEHAVECRFMDLPSAVFLALQAAAEERALAEEEKLSGGAEEPSGESPRHRAEPGGPPLFNKGGERANLPKGRSGLPDSPAEDGGEENPPQDSANPLAPLVKGGRAAERRGDSTQGPPPSPVSEDGKDAVEEGKTEEGAAPLTTESIYRRLEALTGEDHDTFWERTFEQLESPEEYRAACNTFGIQLREAAEDDIARTAENQVREAYMRRTIQEAIDSGVPPEKIFCVCGAFHVRGLETCPPMTDQEAASLPTLESTATLMPYSYYRLSSRSGYGAGNRAPGYFELLWDAMNDGGVGKAPYLYLTKLAAAHRKAGNLVSSAEVIEAVRLAEVLRAMRGSRYPTLRDLRDAAVTTMGHGHFSEISLAAADVEIGKKIGFLPEGVSRTSVQEDFYRQLKALRLEKYRVQELQRLDLDLREKLTVKSRDAALGDLRRSFFLHRLRVLGISFAKLLPSRQAGASWGEYWELRWTPEAEIEIVESSLLGDTIEGAAAFALKERADESASIAQAAAIFSDAFLCGMPQAARHALTVLQGLSADAAALAEAAVTAEQLSLVVRYGDLRQFDLAPVIPLLEQLYLRACLTLEDACVCDAQAAPAVTQAMDRLNALQLNHDFLDQDRWLELLERISDRDDLNTRCSGFAMATLLERGAADEALLAREVSRRLSPGVPADLGAGWFEGLAGKNRYALIARLGLWRHLDEYLEGLDEDNFRRALVFLRRAFADFSPSEKNDIAENLGEIWGVNSQQAAEVLMGSLTVAEQEVLSGLDEFNFDDI